MNYKILLSLSIKIYVHNEKEDYNNVWGNRK